MLVTLFISFYFLLKKNKFLGEKIERHKEGKKRKTENKQKERKKEWRKKGRKREINRGVTPSTFILTASNVIHFYI